MTGLAVRGLHVSYGDLDVVRGVDLAVAPGHLLVVVGPNGAGKSTVLKGIAGLVAPKEGVVEVDGDDVTRVPAHHRVRHGMAVVPQNDNVFPTLTVAEHLDVAIGAAGRGDIDHVLKLIPQIKDYMQQRAGTLSGGQRQLVALARALVTQPTVLLLDEPTAGVQPNVALGILDKVKDIAAAGVAVLLVEQNAKSAMERADEAIVLDRGRVRFQGPGAELLADPEVGRAYLGR